MNLKGNKIIYIGDGVTSLVKIKDYYVFEDAWVCEHDRVLCDKQGNEYNVLDYQEIEDFICDQHKFTSEIQYPTNSWRHVKRSCVKLDKKANIGDILYLKDMVL